jgi:exosortase
MKIEPQTGTVNVFARPQSHLKRTLSADGGVTIDPPRKKKESEDPGATHPALPGFSVHVYSYAFFATLLMSLIVFKVAWLELVKFSEHSEYSYIPLIPLISGFLILVRKKSIFERAKPSPRLGSCMVAGGMLLWFVKDHFWIRPITHLEFSALALVSTWCGLFVLWYGARSARMALLPLCLLLFMVPAPEAVLNTVVRFLQQGSAVLSYELFRLLGVPALREGTVISLPRLTIQVAPECSGIRSSISLLILTLAVGNLYLRFAWNKVLLMLVLIPLAVMKNAIRVVTLSLLAIYVNPGFLNGPLHHRGGIFFFLIALTLLIPIVMVMRWLDRTAAGASSAGAKAGSNFGGALE